MRERWDQGKDLNFFIIKILKHREKFKKTPICLLSRFNVTILYQMYIRKKYFKMGENPVVKLAVIMNRGD